jgi:hypothetical protein
MQHTLQRPSRTVESRLLTMADRLFTDFEELPVKAVFDAITSARSVLRVQQRPATPEAIERMARGQLRGLQVA